MKWNWKDINFQKFGEGISTSLASLGQSTQTKGSLYSLQQQIEMNRENFKAQKQELDIALSDALSSIQVQESRRNVVGGTTNKQIKIKEDIERKERISMQEMLATERNLIFAMELEKVAKKNAKTNALIGVATAAFGGLSDMYNAGKLPDIGDVNNNNIPEKQKTLDELFNTPKPLNSPTPEAQRIRSIFDVNKPLFSPINNNKNGGLF